MAFLYGYWCCGGREGLRFGHLWGNKWRCVYPLLGGLVDRKMVLLGSDFERRVYSVVDRVYLEKL